MARIIERGLPDHERPALCQKSYAPAHRLIGHNGQIWDLACAGGDLVFSAGGDSTIRWIVCGLGWDIKEVFTNEELADMIDAVVKELPHR